MLRLIPAPVHRVGLRIADATRKRWWQWRKPELQSCSVLAFDVSGQLLLIKQSYGTRDWRLPSGGVGRGEQPEQAARRELLEETGCTARVMEFLDIDDYQLHGARNIVHVFATKVSDQPVPDGREVMEACFYPMHSLPHPLSTATMRRLAMWRSAQSSGRLEQR